MDFRPDMETQLMILFLKLTKLVCTVTLSYPNPQFMPSNCHYLILNFSRLFFSTLQSDR